MIEFYPQKVFLCVLCCHLWVCPRLMVRGGALRFEVCLRCVYKHLYSKSVINDGSVQAHKSLSMGCDLFQLLGVLGDIYYQPMVDDSFTSPPRAGLEIKINFICPFGLWV